MRPARERNEQWGGVRGARGSAASSLLRRMIKATGTVSLTKSGLIMPTAHFAVVCYPPWRGKRQRPEDCLQSWRRGRLTFWRPHCGRAASAVGGGSTSDDDDADRLPAMASLPLRGSWGRCFEVEYNAARGSNEGNGALVVVLLYRMN